LLSELMLPRPPGPPQPPGDDDAEDHAYFAVWRADGSLLKSVGLPEDIDAKDMEPPAGGPRLLWHTRNGHRVLAMTGPMRTQILVGKPDRRERDELRAFAWQLAGAAAVVLAVGLAGGWLVSARILRPVAAIANTASGISATNLSKRIDTDGVDLELADLAQVLNATFARLESAFERQVRFTADASHELRTPLAVLRSQAELALARPRAAEDYREALAACLRASERMGLLVDGLLILARADAGKLDVAQEPVDLRRVVEETVGPFQPLAVARGLRFSTELSQATARGDAGRLAQIVTNLVSNAIQYNRPGGSVLVRLVEDEGCVLLEIEDTGLGIGIEDRPHIFERFYRVDKARSRASGGHGLGLAICKSIVEAHAGTIECKSTKGKGSTFVVKLPSANDAVAQ
jgi:heavy metal sensor kinase